MDALYKQDERFGQIIGYFALLAILIGTLGLLGLSSFMILQRTKEIGVRKVLGASVPGIVMMISREFVKWVVIANLIAWPIAYFALNTWLDNFAYRIELGWWVFVLASGLALVIVLLTVSSQAIRTALANPVESLRYE